MHPYFLSALAADHQAYLRASAARRRVGPAERQPGWWSRHVWFLHRAEASIGPSATHVVRLAPVLVMAPPFPPSGSRPLPASPPRERPVELAG
jgi:hypothetical protein